MNTSGGYSAFLACRRKTAAWTTAAALAFALPACSGQAEDGTTPEATSTSSSPPGSFGNPATDGGTETRGDTTTGASSSSAPGKPPRSLPPSRDTDAQAPSQPRAAPSAAPSQTGPPLRNAEANSRFVTVDNPSSLSVVVNKQRPLTPIDYAPSGLVKAPVNSAVTGEGALLRDDAAAAAARMFEAAGKDGIHLSMLSGYRSYASQVQAYNSWAVRLGSIAEADKVSARPGYSEHQTGLALDIGVASGACSLQYCFNNLPAASWAENNAYKYGYIVRYQLGHHLTTGFYAEPWHLRYIGEEDSKGMHQRGISTLEEYFGLPPAPGYL